MSQSTARPPCQHERQRADHAGITSALGVSSAFIWLGVIGMLIADLYGNMPGIVVVLVALVGVVTTVATVQVWTLDRSNARTEAPGMTITRNGQFASGDRGAIGTVIRSAAAGHMTIHDDTAQIPTQGSDAKLDPVEFGKLYRFNRTVEQLESTS